ncbi:MAG: DUF1223 domain-containing protein [Parafilimonas sp.]|nr:DUF1223 domain-containing protein [Parafilimonas sp.]
MKKVFIAACLFAACNMQTKDINKQASGEALLSYDDDSVAKTAPADNGFAVVELFTSEGCSSCPPADNAVAKLLKEHNNNVYVLGYHVDYWDNLGWKDSFSNAAYTQLQRNYAKSFKLSSVYTPQVIVNGTEQFVGSNESKLNATVNKDLQQSSNIQLSVDAKAGDDYELMLHYTTNATNSNIQFALIELSATSKIQRGENGGATLHHVNIVRDIKIEDASSNGTASLTFPEDATLDNYKVIAFTQSKADNKITAATEVKIQ